MATKRTLIGNIKGPKGDTGAQGPQGATGPGATIEVGTVSTTAYGNTAQVTNSGTATAAVLDFVIPQGKPGEQTTKMSGLTLDTVTASTAEYPIPATGDTGSVAWGKVIKFFNDAKTAIASKINISDIVNNLTSTATNKPLSAAQGKALNDALGTANTTIASMKTVSEADLSTDYTQQRTTTIAKAKKLNGLPLVHIRVIETYSINIPGGQNILYLPSGYRPSEQQVVPGLILIGTDSAMHYAPIVISPSGGIRQDISNSMRGLYIDTWIKI